MQGEPVGDTRPHRPYLLASDLDGTLIPVEQRDEYSLEVTRFRSALADNPGGTLAYLTGRHLEFALDGIEATGLPQPDVLVCDVGTSLFERAGSGCWQESSDYARRMAVACGGTAARDQARPLESLAWLFPQEDQKQARFKHSFYFPAERDADEVREELAACLEAAGSVCGLVVSHDPADGRGLVDVLPRGVDKATALEYVRERGGLALDRVVFAGDSGNDTAALLSGCRGILVANAALAVRNQVASEAARRGLLDHVHFATAALIAGVVEGCERFGIFAREGSA